MPGADTFDQNLNLKRSVELKEKRGKFIEIALALNFCPRIETKENRRSRVISQKSSKIKFSQMLQILFHCQLNI